MRKKLAGRKRKQKGFSLRTVIIFGILFVNGPLLLARQDRIHKNRLRDHQKQETERELIKEGQILNYELSKLKSPEFLEPVAKKMGFRFAHL